MKKVISLSLVLMMTFSMIACGGAKTEEKKETSAEGGKTEASQAPEKEEAKPAEALKESVKLSFALWDEVQKPVFDEIIAGFEKENPEIDVEVQLTPWSQYWTKLDAAMGAESAADVFWMNTFLPKYALAGVLEPLDSYISSDGINLTDYTKVVVDMYHYNGQQYCMPKGMDTVQVFYNKNIFEKYQIPEPKEGWTWEDMRQTASMIKEKTSDEYPILMELDPQPSYFNFIAQSGGFVLDKDGKNTGLGMEGTVKAYQDMLALMKDGLMPDNKVLSDTKGTDLFLSQKGAMLFMGSWKTSVLDDASFSDKIGTIEMPKREVGNQSVIGGLGYAMNANSANKDAAWKLIKYLAGEESNKIQAEAKIDVPALLSAQQYYKTKNIDTEVIFKAAEGGYPFPTSPGVAEWFPVIMENSAKIFSEEATPEEACAQMQKQVQGILDSE